ncbi:DUF6311 domain-containing protein [Candidatus Pelagibacter sp.]|nr:DUF6311 domain-containing protein [Candidatus Pelagibacter sp.]
MNNKFRIIKNNNIIIFYIFVSFLFTFYILGPENISPTNEDWLFENDRASDLLVWKYFFDDQWRFPFGANENFGLTISNSIAYSGSPPLYSFIFKIFKFVLPSNFNYFSILIFFSIFLQILIGYLIVYKITKNQIYSLISSFLFIFLPIFLFKLEFHFSLISHWLILSYFYVDLSKKNYEEKKNKFLFILLLSSLIHLYFTIMILLMLSINRTIILSLDKKYVSFFKDIIFYLLPLLILMYSVGYFLFSPINALGGGYGEYNLNLISFFNSYSNTISWSKFLPVLYTSNSESFSYLGLGALMLLINLIVYLIMKYDRIDIQKNLKYIIIVILFTLLAISNNIEFGKNLIFQIELNKYVYAALSTIRASIRMIWPCVYLILIFGIYSVYKNYNSKLSLGIITLLLVLQVFDISEGIQKFKFGKIYNNKIIGFNDIRLENLQKEIEIISGTNIYNENNDFHQIAPYLAKFMPKTEIVYLARIDRKKQTNLNYLNIHNLLNKKITLKKIFYIQTVGQLNHLRNIYKSENVGFFNIDGLWFLIPTKKNKMKQTESKFINELSSNFIINNKEYYLNDYSLVKKDKMIGLGWFFDKTKNKLYSDGEKSFLIYDKKSNSESSKIYLTLIRAYKDLSFKSEFELLVNNKKINIFNIDNKKIEISIDLKKFNTEEIIIELKYNNTRSDFDLKKGIDTKKRSLILESYKVVTN